MDTVIYRKTSDKVLQLTQYWTPPVPFWKPLKRTLNSSLRMACVVEDRIYQGLRFEGHVFLLTPGNWEHVLKHGKPDFLLMESIWETATGHWHIGQSPGVPVRDELLEIVALAGRLSIPTVFWITKGHEYHEDYKGFARYFDYVFCADFREAELLRAEGVKAEVLLPCIQPALYNPFRYYEYYDAFRLDMLYDGWADLDRLGDDLRVLQKVKPYGLNIIESRYQIFSGRKDLLPDYVECIMGCVSKQSLIQALRYAKAYITLDKTLSTTTTQQWMTLEAVASRLPVIHHGSLPNEDIRKEITIECQRESDFLVEFVRMREDDLYGERISHLAWRKTLQKHTFAHRLKRICKKTGIRHDWEEYPKASLITPSYRPGFIAKCIRTLYRQNYPNKELIIILNQEKQSDICLKQRGISNIKISYAPKELFTGACMNVGHNLAEGEYCFKIDDDDYYGENYIQDMILQARCIDADFFGKPPSSILFENDPNVYRRQKIPKICVAPQRDFNSGKIWIGGNSISGNKSFIKRHTYYNNSYGAADSAFMISLDDNVNVCAVLDDFNLIAMRREDANSHTWKMNKEKVLSSTQCIGHKENILC